MASEVVQLVKTCLLSAGDTEMQIQSLGWEDPLEEEMATQSSIFT